MNSGTMLTIASKELRILKRRRSVSVSIFVLPLMVAVLSSLFIRQQVANSIPASAAVGLDSLTYFYVVLAAILPGPIAAYSIVGEKVEKSLEPLFATPASDSEILLGKGIAAFLPPTIAVWVSAMIFMASSDYFLMAGGLSYYYFPSWVSGIMMLLLVPLAAIMSIELTVIASSRVTDVRGAGQIAGLAFIPFMLVFVEVIAGNISYSAADMLLLSLILAAVDAGLFYISKAVFNREEILTKWK